MREAGEVKKALRVSLDERLISGELFTGAIASVFDRAVNIALNNLPSGLVTVLRQGTPLVPDGLVAADDDFILLRSLRPGTAARITGSQLLLGQEAAIDWHGVKNETFAVPCVNPARTVWHESRQKLEQFLIVNRARMGFCRIALDGREKALHLLAQYCQSVTAGDTDGALHAAEGGIGLGMGLTPSFDDALIGCMAVLQSAGLSSPLEAKAANKTTAVSRKYLLCAAQGRFSELLSAAVTAAVTGRGVQKAASALAEVGGTSGCDMLTGIYTAITIYEGWSAADEICR